MATIKNHTRNCQLSLLHCHIATLQNYWQFKYFHGHSQRLKFLLSLSLC